MNDFVSQDELNVIIRTLDLNRGTEGSIEALTILPVMSHKLMSYALNSPLGHSHSQNPGFEAQ